MKPALTTTPPSGNVTFLFTDIEGSTLLVQKHPEDYRLSLQRHHEILTEVINSNNGHVFEIIGDAFCSSFEKAEDAVMSAIEIQRALKSEVWKVAEVNVRIGIHEGEAEWDGSRYSGYLTLAKTQRLMSAAHGRQILISGSVKRNLPEWTGKYSFRDLGERKLKDLLTPEHIFQIVAEGIYVDFPPIKTLEVRPNNLPQQLTCFIGRETELAELKSLLTKTRILTLLGPGGTGKTRLSLQAAAELIDEYPHGVWIAELASLSDPGHIFELIASSLRVEICPGQSAEEAVLKFISNKELLLLLDNCEHLVEKSAEAALKLLNNSTGSKIVATSREALQIPGELTFQVLSMSLPEKTDKITAKQALEYESIRLFLDRATSARKDFKITDENAPVIARLCKEIDGIPLAIELAAARMRVLSAELILEKISDMFKFLSGGKRTALPKQQTLRATIDWSYDLLTEEERLLFMKLGIFTGGATLEAIEEVCIDKNERNADALDLISNLSDKSLIKTNHQSRHVRYSMLQSIRLYAEEKLAASGKLDVVKSKHFDYFHNFALESKSGLSGEDQKSWLEEVETELENIRSAIKWSMSVNRNEEALAVVVSLGIFFSIKGYFEEALELVSENLERTGLSDKSNAGSAFLWKGFFLMHMGRYEESFDSFTESMNLLRESGNEAELANSMNYLSILKLYRGEMESAKELQTECLEIRTRLNDKRGIAASLNSLALFAYKQGNQKLSAKYLKDSIQIFYELHDLRSIAANLGNLGKLNTALGNFRDAEDNFRECLEVAMELGDKYVTAHCLEGLAVLNLKCERYDVSCRLLSLSKKIFDALGIELSGDELMAFDNSVPVLKKNLGDKEFEKEWRSVLHIEEDSAAEYALNEIKACGVGEDN